MNEEELDIMDLDLDSLLMKTPPPKRRMPCVLIGQGYFEQLKANQPKTVWSAKVLLNGILDGVYLFLRQPTQAEVISKLDNTASAATTIEIIVTEVKIYD